MCPFCKASSVNRDLAWEDCSAEAGWRATLWTDETYKAFLRESGMAIPALLKYAVGLRLECVMVDVMHTLDLGVSGHIVGNVLFILAIVSCCFGGRTYADRIQNLNDNLKSWYKSQNIQYRFQGALTMESLRRKKDWPKIRCKAAACRELCKYALFLLVTYGDSVTCGKPWADVELMTSLCQLLVQFYDVLAIGDMFLSNDHRDELARIGQYIADIYCRLARYALDDSAKFWKVVPKLHLFLHLVSQQTRLNPRQFWVYSDEDLVGIMIDIASSLHPTGLPENTMLKWLHSHFSDD